MDILPFFGATPRLDRLDDLNEFTEQAKTAFTDFVGRQIYMADGSPALYIYQIRDKDIEATGLIATTAVQDYLEGRVLRHEDIIPAKEQVQRELLIERQAAVKPVLLVHRSQEMIRQGLRSFIEGLAPSHEFEFSETERHCVWRIDQDKDIEALQNLYRQYIPKVAIADGHHRFSSFARLWTQSPTSVRQRYAYVLSAYFPEDELQIEAFHRVARLTDGQYPDSFLNSLGKLGALQPLPAATLPAEKHEMSLWIADQWYRFRWHDSCLQSIRPDLPALDVNLLNRHILKPLLQIHDLQSEEHLKYIGSDYDLDALETAASSLDRGIAFALYPIHSDDFMRIAGAGVRLSPKATFFRPRLKNGIVVQLLSLPSPSK